MATITENLKSREGDELGQAGFFARREFNVLLRDVGDDVNDPLTPLLAQIPLGMPHPDSKFSGLFSSQYRQGEREDGTLDSWKCEIFYRLPLVFTVSGWDVVFDSTVETRAITHDINGKRIGGNAYRLPDTPASGPPEPATHKGITLDGSVDLVQVPGAVVPYPYEAFVQVSSVSFHKQVPASEVSMTTLFVTQGFAGMVNSDRIASLGVEPGQMMYMGGHAELIGSQSSADASGIMAWDLTLPFQINFSRLHGGRIAGWGKFELFDWYDHKGRRGDVELATRPGEPVREEFEVQPAINFGELFDTYGGLDIFTTKKGTRTRATRP